MAFYAKAAPPATCMRRALTRVFSADYFSRFISR